MKKWRESRNYRQVKNDASEIISYIITVDGIDVEVPEDVYRAYSQADRRERYVREEMEAGKLLSLDKLLEDDVPSNRWAWIWFPVPRIPLWSRRKAVKLRCSSKS